MQVTVTVPATTANLGPGFDCLGMALSLHHTVTFTTTPSPGIAISASGEDAHKIPTGDDNLVWQSAKRLFERFGRVPAGLRIVQENEIPVGSGLGSSSTAVLAGLFGANALLNHPLTTAELLQIAVDVEGHPDNVAPAVHGGLILGVQKADGLLVERIPTPPMTVAVVLPDFKLLTAEARAALPRQVPFADAIFNTGRVALLVRALAAGDYDKLAVAMQDRMHQPYRLPLIPGMAEAFTAVRRAGAAAAALSGAGPSLIAFAPADHARIAQAAAEAFSRHGLGSRQWILTVDERGTAVHAS
jgi:homoserine kinase